MRQFNMAVLTALTCASLALGGCGSPTVQKAKQIVIKGGITNYCKASDASRQALRQEFTTSKGPLVTVHCENLE